jgi:methyl-accepting chemotaxis protein
MQPATKSRIKISAKLFASFATVLALVLALSYSSLTAIARLGASLDGAINQNAKKLQAAGEIRAGFEEMRADSTKAEISLINVFIGRLGTQRGTNNGAACSSCHTTETVDRQKQRFDDAAGRLKGKVAELRLLVATADERDALEKIDRGVGEWRSLYENYMTLVRRHDFTGGHEVMLGRIYPLIDSLDKLARDFIIRQQALLKTAGQEAQARVSSSRMTAFLLLGLCLAAGGVVYGTVRSVNRTLHNFAGEMSEVSQRVSTAAMQVSSSSLTLARGASEQAAFLEETSSSSEEINIMSHRCAEGSYQASTKMKEAAQRMNDADQTLNHMMRSMDAINSSSNKISKIIKVIDEIAFQTNILALNAAVEAARAGEAGLGFAVVAEEVRNLAQRCAQAARDTAALIEESIAMSQDGKGKFDQVTQAIRGIAESAAESRSLVDGVNTSSQEQTRGVEQVTRAITQAEKVTQSNAASAEENAAAGGELNAQSQALKGIVERLVALV